MLADFQILTRGGWQRRASFLDVGWWLKFPLRLKVVERAAKSIPFRFQYHQANHGRNARYQYPHADDKHKKPIRSLIASDFLTDKAIALSAATIIIQLPPALLSQMAQIAAGNKVRVYKPPAIFKNNGCDCWNENKYIGATAIKTSIPYTTPIVSAARLFIANRQLRHCEIFAPSNEPRPIPHYSPIARPFPSAAKAGLARLLLWHG